MLFYDVLNSDGTNVGFNPVQTVAPGQAITYQWYAGDFTVNSTGTGVQTPIEFGATNLISSDPMKHSSKGAFGALVIMPQGFKWTEDVKSRARANVYNASNVFQFRDFTLMFQNDINLRYGDGTAVRNLANEDDAEDSAQAGFNYRTEPLWFRKGHAPETPFSKGEAEDQFGPNAVATRDIDFSNAVSNTITGGADPKTPIFTATAGQAVRFRTLQAGGHQRNNVFTLHGHVWQEIPWTNSSKSIGSNGLSEFTGAAFGVGPSYHMNALPINGAGGKFKITGDYLYRTFASFGFDNGLWGIFRVFAPKAPPAFGAPDSDPAMDPIQ
jgi:hypothetical protein